MMCCLEKFLSNNILLAASFIVDSSSPLPPSSWSSGSTPPWISLSSPPAITVWAAAIATSYSWKTLAQIPLSGLLHDVQVLCQWCRPHLGSWLHDLIVCLPHLHNLHLLVNLFEHGQLLSPSLDRLLLEQYPLGGLLHDGHAPYVALSSSSWPTVSGSELFHSIYVWNA